MEDHLSKLIEDSEFIAIDARRKEFNIFEAIGGVRGELKHSNFLAFLFSPSRPHGLGTRPLELFLRRVVEKLPPAKRPIRPLDISFGDLDGAIVHRERDNIDLLIDIPELNLLAIIENKVGATAGDGQLARYKAASDRYPHRRKLFAYLTPDGHDADELDYVSVSYVEVANIIERLLSAAAPVNGSVELILAHYVSMLRRNIVEDDGLKALAVKVYEKHREALEFIFKYRPDGNALLDIVRRLVERADGLVQDEHTPTSFRFVPKEWIGLPALNSCPRDEWSGTGRNMLFEAKAVKLDKNDSATYRIGLGLILGPAKASLRRYLFDEAAKRPQFRCGKSMNESWVTIYSLDLLTKREALERSEPEKEEIITRNWNDFVSNELRSLTDVIYQMSKDVSL